MVITITYRGQSVEVEVISEINSQARHPGGGWTDACDMLLRDAAGRYYLQRESADTDRLLLAREEPQEWGYLARVHQIGLNAAILWAIKELGNGESHALRCDASALLCGREGYSKPLPFPYLSLEEWRAADDDDEAEEEPELSSDDALMAPPQALAPLPLYKVQWLDDARWPLLCDAQAKAMAIVEKAFEEALAALRAGTFKHAEAELQNVVACVRGDWKITAEDARSVGVGSGGGEKVPAQKVGVSFLLEPLHAALLSRFCQRQCLDVAAVVRASLVSCLEAIFLDPEEELRAARCLASTGRLEPEKGALARWEMMEQADVGQEDLDAIACGKEDDLFPGIRQLAHGPYEMEKDGVFVRPWEDEIAYPGRVTRCGCLYTVPEVFSPFKLGREYTAEDVQWLAWPKDGGDDALPIERPERSAADVRFKLLLPESGRPVEGRVRTIIRAMAEWNAKHGLPDEDARAPIWKAAPDGRGVLMDLAAMEERRLILARGAEKTHEVHAPLDAASAELVKRYLRTSRRELTAADIVNGCVTHALSLAFGDLENAHNHTLASGDGEFADDAWGYVEEDIANARQRRLGQAQSWEEDAALRDASPADPANARRHAADKDVALLAAAAPEGEEDEPQPPPAADENRLEEKGGE